MASDTRMGAWLETVPEPVAELVEAVEGAVPEPVAELVEAPVNG